jgi:hypothetical protein
VFSDSPSQRHHGPRRFFENLRNVRHCTLRFFENLRIVGSLTCRFSKNRKRVSATVLVLKELKNRPFRDFWFSENRENRPLVVFREPRIDHDPPFAVLREPRSDLDPPFAAPYRADLSELRYQCGCEVVIPRQQTDTFRGTRGSCRGYWLGQPLPGPWPCAPERGTDGTMSRRPKARSQEQKR